MLYMIASKADLGRRQDRGRGEVPVMSTARQRIGIETANAGFGIGETWKRFRSSRGLRRDGRS